MQSYHCNGITKDECISQQTTIRQNYECDKWSGQYKTVDHLNLKELKHAQTLQYQVAQEDNNVLCCKNVALSIDYLHNPRCSINSDYGFNNSLISKYRRKALLIRDNPRFVLPYLEITLISCSQGFNNVFVMVYHELTTLRRVYLAAPRKKILS